MSDINFQYAVTHYYTYSPSVENAPQITNEGEVDKGKAPEVKDNKVDNGRNNVRSKPNRQRTISESR